ncbi:hypothetical protein FPSE_09858 [Fusarium pseudograminearum CS3096]|uniref:Uncharacterized protein n=1 Tax=Fusarium pseudograminearum (strain CS3096) TaxID=1028729 RepID=K3VCB7_FUSPC|nr:hypothetical protein FPSE_09858 [Fusarium pseudograminearum CS3096]EKJ70013.1 hypothetical protein FPSE_09858 [Fusarium pseudograminearum CS3096]
MTMERPILKDRCEHGSPDEIELERFQTPKEQPGSEQHHVYQSREESNLLFTSPSSPDKNPRLSASTNSTHHQESRPMGAQTLRKRPKHLRKGLIANLSRWFASVLFVIAIYVVLWHFSQQNVMGTGTKREFNALIIGLSLGLGMSITISLEAMAKEIRWWILELREWSKRETELILKAKDLTKVIQLTWETGSRSIRIYAITFVLLNLVSQIALAMLGLIYSTNTADSAAILKPGNVTVPDFSDLETARVLSSKSQALGAMRYTANRFVFQEWASRPKKYDLVVSTNRTVDATGNCRSWKVTKGGGGNEMSITIADDDRTEVNITAMNGVNQTTFMFDAAKDQGETWSEIAAFEASETSPWFYRCNISFGPVLNAYRKEHVLGVNITSLASSAIALQGYGASSLGPTNSNRQFQSYPAESTYGAPANGNTDKMGALVAAFSAGVVAVVGQAASTLIIPGLQPQNGVVLEVSKWAYVHLILGLSLAVQLLLGVGVAILANT